MVWRPQNLLASSVLCYRTNITEKKLTGFLLHIRKLNWLHASFVYALHLTVKLVAKKLL